MLLVLVRDPKGHEPLNIFVSTDLEVRPQAVVERYASR